VNGSLDRMSEKIERGDGSLWGDREGLGGGACGSGWVFIGYTGRSVAGTGLR